MNDYREMLKGIWTDAKTVMDYEEQQPEWVYSWMHEIEAAINLKELELHKERFDKTMNSCLYKGAKVRVKRDLYFGELWNDPEGQSPITTPMLLKGQLGEISAVDLDEEENDNGYYDCSVSFPAGAWLMRVEWLDFLEDEDAD